MIYEVTLEQSLGGQQCINRFNYVGDAAPVDQLGALLVAKALGAIQNEAIAPFAVGTVLGDLRPLQSVDTLYVSLIVKNLYSVTDFYTYAFPPNTFGENSGGQSLSPTQAVGFSSDRTRSDIRRAQKRFTGVTEADVNAAGVLTAGAQTTWGALGEQLGDIILGQYPTGGVSYAPYVLKRVEYTTPSGKKAYKYYATQSEQEANMARINVMNVKTTTRTQTSRQYGRGT